MYRRNPVFILKRVRTRPASHKNLNLASNKSFLTPSLRPAFFINPSKNGTHVFLTNYLNLVWDVFGTRRVNNAFTTALHRLSLIHI